MNVSIFSGRLTADVESRTVGDDTVYSFCVANQLSKDETVFFNVDAWNKVAEGIAPYLKKGKSVEVHAQYRTNKSKEGQIFPKFRASRIEFAPRDAKGLDTSEDSDTVVKEKPKGKGSAGKVSNAKKTVAPEPVMTESEEEDDDVPFN